MEWGTRRCSLASSNRRPAVAIRPWEQRSASSANRLSILRSAREAPARWRLAQPRHDTSHRRRTCRRRGCSVVGTGRGHIRPPGCNRCRPLKDTRPRRSIGPSRESLALDRWERGCRRAGRCTRPAPRRMPMPGVASCLVHSACRHHDQKLTRFLSTAPSDVRHDGVGYFSRR
jgi:hypothetical protein